jgi:hypothetical protein
LLAFDQRGPQPRKLPGLLFQQPQSSLYDLIGRAKIAARNLFLGKRGKMRV